jgi:hypothetical protein
MGQISVNVQPGDVNVEQLTVAQQDAAGGAYARAMAGYIQWLAPQLDRVRQDFRALSHQRRTELPPTVHPRTADAIAQLSAAWSLWLRFVMYVGAATREEAARIEGTAWEALTTLAAERHPRERSDRSKEDGAERPRSAALWCGNERSRTSGQGAGLSSMWPPI